MMESQDTKEFIIPEGTMPPTPDGLPGDYKSDKIAKRLPIAFKLVTITTLLLLVATVPIALRSSFLFEEVSNERENDVNGDQVKVIADQVESTLQGVIDKTKIVASILYKNNFASEQNREAALDLAFRSDRDLVSVEVWENKDGNRPTLMKRIVNEEYLKQYDLKADFIEHLRSTKPFPIAINFAGDFEIRNSTVDGGAPLMTIGFPLVKDDLDTVQIVVLADIRLDKIQKVFAQSTLRTIYLVDREGSILAHPDEKLALTAKKMNYIPIVATVISTKSTRDQKAFTDPVSNVEYVGAYAKTPFGATVISQVPKSIILEPSRNVRRQAFLITGVVLSLALFFIVLFSATLTRPLEILVHVAKEIGRGNFDTKAEVTTKDEVGELAMAFDNMVVGLRERDKVKNLMNKFHGAGVTSKLMEGEMKLGGEQREATVFFSDIRGFTAFSEKVQPQDVVNMLNEYFKVMVSIIQKNHGVVDKFIGDAIMAVWGAPESFGNDAVNAVRASIEMRLALVEINNSRTSRGLPAIKIGMGIHSGPLIAGTIGSDDRMEYTVIGDTVNMASRIEAATKAYGTDLLVSESTFEQVKDFFTFDLAGSAQVKGKEEPLKLFKVTGYIDESGQHIKVETEFSAYQAEHADKIKTA